MRPKTGNIIVGAAIAYIILGIIAVIVAVMLSSCSTMTPLQKTAKALTQCPQEQLLHAKHR